MKTDFTLLSVERLPVGYSLRRPILEATADNEILPAGTEISLSLVQSLINQGDHRVRVHKQEVELFKLPPVLWKEGSLDPGNWNHCPVALLQYVRANLPKRTFLGNERRQYPRYPFATRVLGVALDERYEPTGATFEAVSRDISATGIALFHTRSISDRFLLIDLSMPSGRQTRFIIDVVRCQAAGRFYAIAGKFVAKYDREEPVSGDRGYLKELSLQTRKRVYLQLTLAKERADQEAKRRYPREESYGDRQMFAWRRLRLRRETIEKVFNVTVEQLEELVEEGNAEVWFPGTSLDPRDLFTSEPRHTPR